MSAATFILPPKCAPNILPARLRHEAQLNMLPARSGRPAPLGLLLTLGLLLALAQQILLLPAHAQGSMLEISMEELVDDTWNRQVVARGNVEIRYYGEILVADAIAYDRDSRKLTAKGNVSL